MKQKMFFVIELKEEHVGKTVIDMGSCPTCNRKNPPLMIRDLMGHVMKQDVGKRIYRNQNGIYYVENQEQYEKRTRKVTA
jgi:hypothetical protein